MFEDSVFESRGALASSTRRWTALTSVTVQTIAAALLVVLPILHPEALQFASSAPRAMLLAPAPPPKPPEVVRVVRVSSTADMMAAPATRVLVQGHLSRSTQAGAAQAPTMEVGLRMGGWGLPGDVLNSSPRNGPAVRVVSAPGGRDAGGRNPLRFPREY